MQEMKAHNGREGKAGGFPSIEHRGSTSPQKQGTGDGTSPSCTFSITVGCDAAPVLLVLAAVLSDQLGIQHPIWPQRDKAGQLGGHTGGILSKVLGMAAPLPLNTACASSFLSLSRFIYNSGWIFLIITMISPAEL